VALRVSLARLAGSGPATFQRERPVMDTLLIIVIVLLLFGGGGWGYSRWRR